MELVFVRLVEFHRASGCGLPHSFKPIVDSQRLTSRLQHLHQKKKQKKKGPSAGGTEACEQRLHVPGLLLICLLRSAMSHLPETTADRAAQQLFQFIFFTTDRRSAWTSPDRNRLSPLESRVASETRGRKRVHFLCWLRLLAARSLKSSCPN